LLPPDTGVLDDEALGAVLDRVALAVAAAGPAALRRLDGAW
jgi:hypothetical protein